MTGTVLIGLAMVHVVLWIVQVMVNQVGGGTECLDISSFACGSPVLQQIAEMVQSTDTGGFLGLALALGNMLKSFFPIFFSLIFFQYGWLSGGGELVDLVVNVFRVILGCIFIGSLYRAAISLVGSTIGRLAG